MEQSFEQFLISQNVLGFHDEPVTFKSGIQSRWYVNCRRLSQTLSVLEASAVWVADMLATWNILIDVDAVIGVPEGATLLGDAVHRELVKRNVLTSDRLYALRMKPKLHGDPANRFWVNGNVPKRVIVLEDVTTTGGSALSFVQTLRDAGTEVVAVVGLVNRLHNVEGKTVVQNFEESSLKYFSLTTAEKLLPAFLATFSDSERERMQKIIDAEYHT